MIDIKQMQQSIKDAVPPLVDFIFENYPQLKTMDSAVELQTLLEDCFSKRNMNEMVQWIIFPEEKRGPWEEYCKENDLPFETFLEVFAELSIHRRMTDTDMLNTFRSHFESQEACLKFFDKLVESKVIQHKDGVFIVYKDDVLSQDDEALLECCQNNPCMVVPPKKIKISHGRYRNGFLTLGRGIFSKKAFPHLEVPVDFLNTQNRMPYCLNFAAWDNYISNHPEIPERDSKDDDNAYDKKILEAMRHHYKKTILIELYRRLGVDTVYILNMYDFRGRNYPLSYLLNPQGQDADKGLLAFKPQPVTKAGYRWLCISIANCFNDKIDGVDADKCTYDKREQWFLNVIQPKMSLEYKEFIEWLNTTAEKADSPACFWSQVHNMWWIQKNLREGKEALVWVITHFDATASGYQLQAIFAKDWQIAELTNLIDPNSRKDLYSVLYNELIARGIPNTYTRNQVKKKCFIPAVYNSVNSIKELFQESKEQEIFYETMNQFAMWRMNRLFPRLWQKDYTEYSFRYPDGFKAYRQNIVNVKEEAEFQGRKIMFNYKVQTTKKFSCELGPNITHGWDGYVARELSRAMTFGVKRKNKLIKLRLDKSSWAINTQFVWSKEDLESRKTMRNLLALGDRFKMYSLRILTEANALNIDLIPDEVFEELFNSLPNDFSWVSEIHDSFGVCPNQAEELMQQYRLNLYRIAKSKALPCVLEDYLGQYPQRFDFGRDDEFAEAIKRSVYALC